MVLKQSAKDSLCFVDGSGNKFTVNNLGEYTVKKSSSEELNGISQLNPLSANPTKWSSTIKQFVVKLPTSCLSVFDQFVG